MTAQCATCKHAKFRLTEEGHVDWRRQGTCSAMPIVRAPDCVKITISRIAIWPGDGATCLTWQPGTQDDRPTEQAAESAPLETKQ